MSQVTLTRHSEAVDLLSVDRPPANALDAGLLEELVAGIETLGTAPPKALVVTGTDGVFSAGADLKAVPEYGPDDQARMVHGINAMALGLYALRCPVVVAITGHAIAGGLVLALCGDVRIASDAGRYGLTEIKVGVPYPQAAIGVVRAELTPQAIRALVWTNRLHSGADLLRLGVFDEVVAPHAVLPRALEVAAELGAFPADAYARTKNDLRGETITALRTAADSDPLLDRWVS